MTDDTAEPAVDTAPTEDSPPESAEASTAQPEATATAQMPAHEPLGPSPNEPLKTAPSEPLSPSSLPPPTTLWKNLLSKANEVLRGKKQKHLDKIMSLLREKGRINNNDVQKLLHVSDATATRYLAALEREGKLKQQGQTGQGVTYVAI